MIKSTVIIAKRTLQNTRKTPVIVTGWGGG